MSGRNCYPFTASQWQELEHQALIFKYMISGVPIPPYLLLPLKPSLDSSNLILHQPRHNGWNSIERKIDTEPGRCKRTDGKKWRCSKEAYPHSKYCERHMHRGRNRSRKPVEEILTSSSSTNRTNLPFSTLPTIPISSISKINNTCLSLSSMPSHTQHYHTQSCYNNNSSTTHPHRHFFYPPPSRPPGIGFSAQDNTTQANKDYRDGYYRGMKEEVADEQAVFSGTNCGTMRSYGTSSMDDSLKLTPLSLNNGTHWKQRTCSGVQSGSNYFQGLTSIDASKQQFYEMPFENEKETQPKVMHRFFDEWPPMTKDLWLDSESKTSNHSEVSTTQLSISMPNSYDFFTTCEDK